ncbi:beta strand repeat-containing protein [Arcticibacterium luteifluviistationis]|uniref:Right handed beta helix domain-containing protein n=1 Tax=Arcticibacterium luteifluviistationis TaxID=1784714 RepID=A0A2Z4GE31_9BACT|nr:Ig-like domain-containing protein [Arcticibacterium luteifluviistationis]AWV99377.1 hypothetical protein DJ013_14890 [Arcticibacterium luteifluviistationis]
MKLNLLFITYLIGCAVSFNSYSQILKVTQSDSLIIDGLGDHLANPGDSIRYKVQIINESGQATGLMLDSTLINETYLDINAGSVHISPLARLDSYTAVGNIGISVDAGSGLLSNDLDIDSFKDAIKILKVGISYAVTQDTSTTFSTANGSKVNVKGNGSFTFMPAAGFTGIETFYYEISDGDSLTPNDKAQVNITVGGASEPLIWFVDATNGNDGTGDGTFDKPFKTLSPLNNDGTDLDKPGDIIYLYSGSYASTGVSSLTLEGNQKLIGQGVALNLSSYGITAPAYSANLPGVSSKPVISNSLGAGLLLGPNNQVMGLQVGNCATVAIENAGSQNVGDVKISDVDVINTSGSGVQLANGSGSGANIVFNIFQVTGPKGIDLTAVSGLFQVNSNVSNINSFVESIKITEGNGLTFTYPGSVNINSGALINISQSVNGSAYTFSNGNISSTSATGGVVLSNNQASTIVFNNPTVSITSTSQKGVLIQNSPTLVTTFNQTTLFSLKTSTFNGIEASNGGTLNISNGNVTTTTGMPVSLTDMALDVNLKEINADASTYGLYLKNTTGSFDVLGDASINRNNSGGIINNATADGVYLENATNVKLSNLNILNSARHGLYGKLASNLDLNACIIKDNGDAIDENGIHLLNFKGSGGGDCVIDNTLIEGSTENNIYVLNNIDQTGTDSLTISNSIVQKVSKTLGSNGILIEAGTEANVFALISNSNITDNRSFGLNAQSVGSGTLNVQVSNNIFNTLQTSSFEQVSGVFLGANALSNMTFDVNQNTIIASTGSGIVVNGFSSAFCSGLIGNNSIDPGANGIGIDVKALVNAAVTLTISNNTINNSLSGSFTNNSISDFYGNGLRLVSDEGTGSLHAQVLDNVVAVSNGINPSYAYSMQSGGALGATNSICVKLEGNGIDRGDALLEDYASFQNTGTVLNIEGLTPVTGGLAAEIESFILGTDLGPATAYVAPASGNYIVDYKQETCRKIP